MSTIQDKIQAWAKEAEKMICACRDSDSDLVRKRKNLAAKSLERFLQLPDTLFDPTRQNGMFGEKVSLWNEMAAPAFTRLSRLSSCPGVVRDFRCDVNELDVYRVLVVNGGLSGGRGLNALNGAKPPKLGGEPCVCRVGDLEPTEENLAKLRVFFEQAEKDLHIEDKGAENGRKVMKTADFAQGSRYAGMQGVTPPKKSSENDFRFYRWLNRALSDETLLVYVPAGCRLDKPLQIVHLLDASQPSFVQGQCWVMMEENASMTLVQCTDSNPQTPVTANVLTEIRLGEGAELECIRLQNVGDPCRLFHNIDVEQARGSRFRSYNINLNGGMTRCNLEVNLNETRARAELFGLYLEDRTQKMSHHVKVNHWAENTYSRELFKGVMDDAAAAWFKGHIFVSPDAQQTEAYQTCRNLVISPKAQANAKPYLEIYADDVQCSHGITVGQLDEDALFYMRSRGIPVSTARRLLMLAYADEILSPISVESIRLWLTHLVKQRFSGQLKACEQCTLACGKA